VSLLTNGDPPNDDEEHYTKVKDKCENKGFIKVKVKGHAKTRPVGGSEKTKTSVQSQWERARTPRGSDRWHPLDERRAGAGRTSPPQVDCDFL